jgi:F0F1-type ATP synthase membrane subunit c/vacuolar-type H+-ATPase subunit K
MLKKINPEIVSTIFPIFLIILMIIDVFGLYKTSNNLE